METSGNRSDPSNPALDDLTAMGDRLYFLEDENESIFGLDSVWRTTGKADTLLRVGTILNPSILPMDPNGPAVDRLYVKWAIINEGPKLKRWMPAAMGRATPVHKRTSHVEIIVAEKEGR